MGLFIQTALNAYFYLIWSNTLLYLCIGTLKKTAEAIEMCLKFENKISGGAPKSYMMEELISRYITKGKIATQGTISVESARILMERGT